jgi:hypothetical protein
MAKKSKADMLRERGDIAGLEREMLLAPDWLDRIDAAESLAMSGNEGGIDYLLKSLSDSNKDVREVAIDILQNLENPRAQKALKEIQQNSILQISQEDKDIPLECGNCGNTIPINSKVCPHCGIKLFGDKIHMVSSKNVPAAQAVVKTSGGVEEYDPFPNEVVVVDFDIPFGSLVWLLVKIALASIPALMILGVILSLVSIIFGGAIFGFLRNFF